MSTTLTGTWSLLRLAARRDRVTVPVWILVIVGLMVAQVGGLEGIYRTDQDRMAYALTSASSVPARLFGSVDGPSLGSITMVEIGTFAAILVALMSSMLVVRHTRQNEERGRLELVRSAVVGRHASLAAAMLLALATNVVLVAAVAVTLPATTSLPLKGTAMMAITIGGVGVTFAALAAVAAQLSPSARFANGIGSALVAVAFVARAFGDVMGDVSADRMHVEIAWPSWLSPIGWMQLAYPYGAQRRWALTPFVVVTALLLALAVTLESRRDVGRGLLAERRGRPAAGRSLTGPLGLAWRLHRGTFVAWSVGIIAMGAVGGVFTSEIESMLGDNEQAKTLFEAYGGTSVFIDAYQSVMITYLGVFVAAFALQVTLRLRAEEHGPGESLLAAGAGRVRWMASHIVVAGIGSAVVLAASGITMDLLTRATGYGAHTDGIVTGTLAQLPAVLVFVGVAALGFSVSGRVAAWCGWGLFAVATLVLIGSMLDLPEWVLKSSPFTHVPTVPVEPLTAKPLLALGSVAALAMLVGMLGFRRRDVDVGA